MQHELMRRRSRGVPWMRRSSCCMPAPSRSIPPLSLSSTRNQSCFNKRIACCPSTNSSSHHSSLLILNQTVKQQARNSKEEWRDKGTQQRNALAHLILCVCVCVRADEAFVVSEFTLVLLHLLSALHDHLLLLRCEPLVVTMLSRQALINEVQRRLRHPIAVAASHHAFAAASSSDRASRSREGRVLRFAAHGRTTILLRWCESWSEAIDAPKPPRVVYLPTLFWLLKECSLARAAEVVGKMVLEIKATLWPPTSWEAVLERKDEVFGRLNEFMIPARWVKLKSVGNDVVKLAESLLAFCRSRGDGNYFVKASTSCDGDCAKKIVVKKGQCANLVGLLNFWVSNLHQDCFGIQPFVEGFGDFELRTWLLPEPDTHRWRQVLTIKSMLTSKGPVPTNAPARTPRREIRRRHDRAARDLL